MTQNRKEWVVEKGAEVASAWPWGEVQDGVEVGGRSGVRESGAGGGVAWSGTRGGGRQGEWSRWGTEWPVGGSCQEGEFGSECGRESVASLQL